MDSTKNKKNKKNQKNKKSKSNQSKSNQSNKNTVSVSGLPHSELLISIISSFTGLFIFLLGPYVVNKLGKPVTAACFNLVPTGIIMGLFVATAEFDKYFTSVLFVPIYNIIINIITYWLYKNSYLSALNVIVLQIVVWLFITFVSLFI